MSDEELAAMPDEECEHQALHLSVLDANWRRIWEEYERRGIGMIAQVLRDEKVRRGYVRYEANLTPKHTNI